MYSKTAQRLNKLSYQNVLNPFSATFKDSVKAESLKIRKIIII